MSSTGSYKARQFNLSGLKGISDQTLEMHFKLYEGYVKETNNLTERITEFIKDGNVDQEEMPAYSELTRRLGFEYNGMVLHEYYFDNLQSGGGTGDPAKTSQFVKAAEATFGSYDIWKADFVGIGKMRGVGWAICYQNPANGRLSNHWITLHETGNVAGLHADPGDGRLGARVPARLQTRRATEIHRGVLLEHRVGRGRESVEETHRRSDRARLERIEVAAEAGLPQVQS